MRKQHPPRQVVKGMSSRQGGVALPPMVLSSNVVSRKIRFSGTANAITAITDVQLLDLWCMATSATAAYRVAQACRIRRITMWAVANTISAATACSIQLFGSTGSLPSCSGRVMSVSTLGSANMDRVTIVPKRTEVAGMWLQRTVSGSTTVFNIDLGPNSSAILELDIDYTLNTDDTPVAVTGAVSAATTGQIYTRSLDGPGGNWSVLTGQGLLTI